MKLETYEKYVAMNTDLPQRALLTAWECLGAYHDDLVLAGGLAVKYLTHPPQMGEAGPVTLDVDFGIYIGASSHMSAGIKEILYYRQFDWDATQHRFCRMFDGFALYIDLLTDDETSESRTVIVDDGLPVGIIPGINRALEVNRSVNIKGVTLEGVELEQMIRVAEVGPMLALKLNAFGGRMAAKDAYDVFYLAMKYIDGSEAAIAGYREEREAGNPAIALSDKILEQHFLRPDAAGPVASVSFCMSNQHEQAELLEDALKHREQYVTLAQELLA